MSADPYMERVQARVVDLAEQSWRDARLAEVNAAAPAKSVDWHTAPCSAKFHYYSAEGEWHVDIPPADWHPPTPLPTSEQYADAERLLRDRGPLDADAARLRCWITDTRPLAVKAGWIADEDLDLDDYTTITDNRILADLASRAPRPSLWTRIDDKWIAAGVVALFILLLLTPWLAS